MREPSSSCHLVIWSSGHRCIKQIGDKRDDGVSLGEKQRGEEDRVNLYRLPLRRQTATGISEKLKT